jgi:hypothetical protein
MMNRGGNKHFDVLSPTLAFEVVNELFNNEKIICMQWSYKRERERKGL